MALEKLRCLLQVLHRVTSVLWSTAAVAKMESLDDTDEDACMGAAAVTDTASLEKQLARHLSRVSSPPYGNSFFSQRRLCVTLVIAASSQCTCDSQLSGGPMSPAL